MSILHVFDLDGTLIRGTTASIELARSLNLVDEFHRLEAQFAEGRMTTSEFARLAVEMWRGLSREAVELAFYSSPWIEGVREVFSDIRERSERSMVITMSPNFFADHLVSFGADEVFASAFPSIPLIGDVSLQGVLSPNDKVCIVAEALNRLVIPKKNCITYGDSTSDIPLFSFAENSVAINASIYLKSLSKFSYDGGNMMDAYFSSRAFFGFA